MAPEMQVKGRPLPAGGLFLLNRQRLLHENFLSFSAADHLHLIPS